MNTEFISTLFESQFKSTPVTGVTAFMYYIQKIWHRPQYFVTGPLLQSGVATIYESSTCIVHNKSLTNATMLVMMCRNLSYQNKVARPIIIENSPLTRLLAQKMLAYR